MMAHLVGPTTRLCGLFGFVFSKLTSFEDFYAESAAELVENWQDARPGEAKWGWGPSVQAEKWNGRHAMFGWVFLCASAYAHGHHLIPNADTLLDIKQLGMVALQKDVQGQGMVAWSQERAVIFMANIHFLCVSLCATIAPLPWADPLLIDETHSSYDRLMAREQEPFGYLPEIKTGLTEEAEIINGRLAMLGIFVLAMATAIENKNMLDIINDWVGGLYYV
eukprot:CAMPEP_0116830422 /NCGR_PEP_ID=MMETSP0418-20121206/4754_1 /TAXON_ID=1158023 /ORGANISM="Astrosyne radiata, Strain 13vi08-1A" /LENGTH=221 /DNA_ID=CAMNT_0004459523 /DNA_START=423 /DNA_END=1089 /DNA_ORIENTATION=+